MIKDEIRDVIEDLRRKFDDAFTRPPDELEAATVELLLVRAGGSLQAVPIRELKGVRRCPPVTPVPSRAGVVVGVVGIRGILVPVIPLATLLGTSSGAETGSWLLLSGTDPLLGLSFDELKGYARMSETGLHAPAEVSKTAAHRIGVYRDAGEACDVISVKYLTQELVLSHASRSQ